MNEGLLVQLMMGNTPVPIRERRSDGLIFDGEADMWPRRVLMNIVPRSDTAAYRMRRIRQINNWTYPEYKLRIALKDGCLLFTGISADGLPSGDYWFSIEIEDLPSVANRYKLYLKDDVETTLQIQVGKDPRRIGFAATMDPEISRVLAASSIGNEWPLTDWLKDDRPRTSRKACLLNLMAKLRTAPSVEEPLIKYVERLFFVGTERVYAKVEPAFMEELEAFARDPKKPFYKEGRPNAPIHFRLLSLAKINVEEYELTSFRQEGHPSMQAVIASPKSRHGDYFADLDIDMGNPLQDVQGFLIHMSELLNSAPTDHMDLGVVLAKDKNISPFMSYSLA